VGAGGSQSVCRRGGDQSGAAVDEGTEVGADAVASGVYGVVSPVSA